MKDTLYHYCSNQSFESIIRQSSVRLSSISLANDTMEGKIIAHKIERLAKEDELDESHIQRLLILINELEKLIDGLCFCLSEEGDLLSQWRGYANDARGVSIGFSYAYLEKYTSSSNRSITGCELKAIKYSEREHENIIKPTYEKAKDLINKGAFKHITLSGLLRIQSKEELEEQYQQINQLNSELTFTILTDFFSQLYALKAKAFNEEREWRLFSVFSKNENAPLAYNYKYAALDNRIVPYREANLIALDVPPIKEIIVGPKNITPDYVFRSLLKQYGFNDVEIKRSELSYR